jgi:PAS domain S-box-containing protein
MESSDLGPRAKQPLRALFVEDDEYDFELQRTALRHDFALDARRVETGPDFQRALAEWQPRIVLCDYELPRFSGMEALHIWHAAGTPVPFIFVTGRLSEEVAVECIKAGATDYVLKGNLARLPMAIGRALREFAATEALHRTEAERARIAAAVEQADEVVVITDPDGMIVYVNPAFTLVTGYAADEALGQTPRLLRSGKQDRAFYAQMWRSITAGEVWRGEVTNRRRNGSLYEGELTITPVFDAEGRIVHYCGIQRDVSARVAAERHLRELYQALAETDRLKDQFLAAFSHELRTPLNVVLGYADILRETIGPGLDPESRHCLESIHRSAAELAGMIAQTLDLAHLRAESMVLSPAHVEVGELVREIADSFASLASTKGLELVCELPPAAIDVETDRLRLRQIISNLVDNAVKFTDRGRVTIGVQIDERELTIRVADTGIGIAPDSVGRVFEDFLQLDGSPTRRFRGCGLGLAVARRLAGLLGGDITVESELNRGTTFSVRLPRTPPTAATAPGGGADE